MYFMWHLRHKRKCIFPGGFEHFSWAVTSQEQAGRGRVPGGWRVCFCTPPHPFVTKALQVLLWLVVAGPGCRRQDSERTPGADPEVWARSDGEGRWKGVSCSADHWLLGILRTVSHRRGWEWPVPTTWLQFSQSNIETSLVLMFEEIQTSYLYLRSWNPPKSPRVHCGTSLQFKKCS